MCSFSARGAIYYEKEKQRFNCLDLRSSTSAKGAGKVSHLQLIEHLDA